VTLKTRLSTDDMAPTSSPELLSFHTSNFPFSVQHHQFQRVRGGLQSSWAMILGQVSWLDCFIFLVFLAPQLIIHVGFFPTLFCGLKALPFLRMSYLFLNLLSHSSKLEHRIMWRPQSRLFKPRLTDPCSDQVTPDTRLWSTSPEPRIPASVCTASFLVWRYCCSVCPICLYIYPRKYREGILLKTGSIAFLEVSDVETWVSSFADTLAWIEAGTFTTIMH